jgi:hypothetical protein
VIKEEVLEKEEIPNNIDLVDEQKDIYEEINLENLPVNSSF